MSVPPFCRSRRLPSAHLETIVAALSKKPQVQYTREIIQTRDNDEIALDYLRGEKNKPLLVLFHGLEGCSQSRTMRVLAHYFSNQNWTVAVPHFRGCGGHANRLPRAYHAGDATDVEWMIAYCRTYFPHSAIYAVGVSLGGSALIHFLTKGIFTAPAVTISTPFDLSTCVEKLDKGINRRIYARHFLKTLRPKIIAKSYRFPSICDLKKLNSARTIAEIDTLYTAPVHGFGKADTYWRRASTTRLIEKVTSPLLCINALNDPLIPAATLPAKTNNKLVQFSRPQHGGHGGFIGTPTDWLANTVQDFFNAHTLVEPSAKE